MKRPTAAAALAVDHGPSIRRDRGDVVVVERPDIDRPNAPNVRGASLYDPMQRILTEYSQHLAVERFRDDHALAEGARESAPGGTPGWNRCYPQKQLDAIQAHRSALQAVGLPLSAVFLALVIGRARPRMLEREMRLRNGAVGEMMREAANRLADHYARA